MVMKKLFDHGEPSYEQVNQDVIKSLIETGPKYWMLLATTIGITVVCFIVPWMYQIQTGIGVAGMNRNSVWGTYLSNFIFWI